MRLRDAAACLLASAVLALGACRKVDPTPADGGAMPSTTVATALVEGGAAASVSPLFDASASDGGRFVDAATATVAAPGPASVKPPSAAERNQQKLLREQANREEREEMEILRAFANGDGGAVEGALNRGDVPPVDLSR